MNNQDSLRTQIIESMKAYCDTYKFYTLNERMMFDEAIMPVLDKAMAAGELLLHRATTPQRPTSELIVDWLDNSCESIAKVREQEHTLSKRQLLRLLYIMEENALKALADARAEKGQQVDTGVRLPGLTTPNKG